ALNAPLRRVLEDGAPWANNFLMHFQADILGVPVERPAVIETTALGAAGLAGLAVGMWSSPEDFLRYRRVDRVFEPRQASGELYARWKEAVRRAQRWA